MTLLFTTKVRDLVIPIGEDSVSPIVQSDFETGDAQALLIITPADADPVGYYIEVAASGSATEADTFYPLEDDNGNLVQLAAPGNAKNFSLISWPSWRVKALAPVSKETSFPVFKSHF